MWHEQYTLYRDALARIAIWKDCTASQTCLDRKCIHVCSQRINWVPSSYPSNNAGLCGSLERNAQLGKLLPAYTRDVTNASSSMAQITRRELGPTECSRWFGGGRSQAPALHAATCDTEGTAPASSSLHCRGPHPSHITADSIPAHFLQPREQRRRLVQEQQVVGSVTSRIAQADQEQDRGADRDPAHCAAVRATARAGAWIDLGRRGDDAAVAARALARCPLCTALCPTLVLLRGT